MILAEHRAPTAKAAGDATISFRHPEKADGARVRRLIKDCPPLDENSLYCNFLQCAHFSETCVIAERDGNAVGWISAYRPPNDQKTLFVWQVAVSSAARGEGLGKALIETLLSSKGASGATHIRTTITQPNKPSWALFTSVATKLGATLSDEPWLEQDRDFGGSHDTEHLVTIGPFTAR